MGPTYTWSLRRLRIRINWLILASVLFAVFGLVRLGTWQLDRAGEKLAAQAAFDQQQLQNASPIETIDLTGTQPSELKNLHVSLAGSYDNAHTILVLAQFFNGQIGYEVVTPFRIAGNGSLVLVSRGWTSGILPPDTPPSTRPVEGPVALTAQIHVPDADQPVLSSQVDARIWPLRVRSVEIEVLDRIFAEPLFPYLVRLTEGQPGMLVRHWPETNVDIDTHLSYALQWFTFAFLVATVALLASSNLIALLRDPEEQKFHE